MSQRITRSKAAKVASTSTTIGTNNPTQSQPSAFVPAANANPAVSAGATFSQFTRPRRNRRLTEKAKTPDVGSGEEDEGADSASDDEYIPKRCSKLTNCSRRAPKAAGKPKGNPRRPCAVRNVHHGMPEGKILLWQRGYWGGIAQPRSVQEIADEIAIISGWTNVQGQSAQAIDQAQKAIKNAPNRIRKNERAALNRWITATAGANEAKKFLDQRAAASKVHKFNPLEKLLKYGNWRPSVTVDTPVEDPAATDDEADDEQEDGREEDDQVDDVEAQETGTKESGSQHKTKEDREESESVEEGEIDENKDVDMDLFAFDGDSERNDYAGGISSPHTTATPEDLRLDSDMAESLIISISNNTQTSVTMFDLAQAGIEDIEMQSPSQSEMSYLVAELEASDISDGEWDIDTDSLMESPVIGEPETNVRDAIFGDVPMPSSLMGDIFQTDDPELDALMRDVFGED